MNNFTKQWLTSTCAPESIINIKNTDVNYLDCVRNEDNTIKIYVLSSNDKIIAIGATYSDLLNSQQYTFSQGIRKIASLLELVHYIP